MKVVGFELGLDSGGGFGRQGGGEEVVFWQP